MPAPSKNFILCVHAHQPVGNFGGVFEEAYEKCYRPFFEAVERHPKFKLACHFSGSLLDWLEAERPEFLQKVKRLSGAGQVEVLGGAYYEPIYSSIPQNDLAGQIDMMQKKVETLFGRRPEGAWLTERVWDPSLVRPLEKAGVAYTLLDDTHFEKAGRRLPVNGHYRARGGGGKLGLFASQKELRYLVPFCPASESLEYLRKQAAGPSDVIVLADDCEKFGFWPGTDMWVYGQGWLERWMTLMENEPGLTLTTFREFRASFAPGPRVAVPPSSYSEMMEWSGGRFDNFFDKYPESRYMKERMQGVSERLSRVNGSHPPAVKDRARSALYRAQCNCSYWHGVFGGLYLHHLRSAVFENLIRADGWMEGKGRGVSIAAERIGPQKLWVMRQKMIVSYFNPGYGAAMEELDYLPLAANLTCTMQRQPEPYHALAEKKKGASGALTALHEMLGSKVQDLEQAICYDPFRRLSFLDHFFAEPVTWEDFHRSSYEEAGDFTAAKYKGVLADREGTLAFERRGILQRRDKRIPLHLRKSVRPAGDSQLEVRYALKNLGREAADFTFGVEFNFSIGGSDADRQLEKHGVDQWSFKDAWRGIELKLGTDRASTVLSAPVETVSGSESGLEKTYQQLAVLFQSRWRLEPGETREQTLSLNAGESR